MTGSRDLRDEVLHLQTFSISNQSERTQPESKEALRSFRAGRALILVAKNVVARGLDIPIDTHAINCDPLSHIDDYMHRTGWTGCAGVRVCAVVGPVVLYSLLTTTFIILTLNIVHGLSKFFHEPQQGLPPFMDSMATFSFWRGRWRRWRRRWRAA